MQYWNGAFTMHGNAIGHPAASVPAGFSADGLPVADHRAQVRRGDGAGRVGGFRGGAAMDSAAAGGVLEERLEPPASRGWKTLDAVADAGARAVTSYVRRL